MIELYRPSTGIPGHSTSPLDPARCAIAVWTPMGRTFNYGQCTRKALHDAVVDGQAVKVCTTHSPAKIAEREAAKQARHDKEKRAWDRRHKRPTAYRDALRLIADGHNDPRGLAREALEKWGDYEPKG